MSVKIKSISLKNFRGAKNPVLLESKQEESVLLYGDNGTGKSSFLDGVEWFLRDSIAHLSGEEIKKHEGLRFNSSENEEESFVEIEFSNKYKNKKSINFKKDKMAVSLQKTSDGFKSFLDELSKEKLWIKNNELIDFILKTKTNRLADMSSIIGYEEASKVNKVLKKSVSDIEKVIREKGFAEKEATIKGLFLENLGEAIHNQEKFYSVVNKKIQTFFAEVNEEIKDEESFNSTLKYLKCRDNTPELQYRVKLERLKNKNRGT